MDSKLGYDLNKSKMILIGTSEYNKESGFDSIKNVENNLIELEQILLNPQIFGFPKENIEIYHNAKYQQDIYNYLEDLDDKIDLLFMYYSGHGIIDSNQDYLMTLTETKDKSPNTNSISFNKLKETITGINARLKIIVLDSCWSGKAIIMSHDISKLLEIKGAIVITSSPHNKPSLANGKNGFTVFTGALIEILKNGIENDKQFLTFRDVYDNLKSKLKKIKAPIPQIQITQQVEDYNFIYNYHFKKKHRLRYLINRPKVLLVKISSQNPIKNKDFGVPLGLWVLKSYLQKYNYDVDIFDERLNEKEGININFKDKIKDYDVVGISICTSELPSAINMFRQAKLEGLITIAGGIFVYSNENYLLKYSEIDYVIPGVATKPFRILLEKISNNKSGAKISDIPNVYCKQDSGSISNQNYQIIWTPDTIPFIDKPVMNKIIKMYAHLLNNKFDIVTSRGCFHRCEFCSIQRECSRTPRTRNTLDVIDDIVHLGRKGFTLISIKDEIFPIDTSRNLHILKRSNEILENEGYKVNYKVKSRLDIIKDNPNILKELSDLNVIEIQYGVETLDQSGMNLIHKRLEANKKKLKEFITKNNDLGIKFNASFILGIEGEDMAYYKSLEEFMTDIYTESLKVYINFYTPHPFNNTWPTLRYSKLINNDLSCFTHKIPVLCPDQLKSEKEEIINTYENIVKITNSREFNPSIPEKSKKTFLNNFKDQASSDLPIY